MPVSRPSLVTFNDYRSSTALGTVLATVFLIGAPQDAIAQATIDPPGLTLNSGENIASGPGDDTITITSGATVTFNADGGVNPDNDNTGTAGEEELINQGTLSATAGEVDFNPANTVTPANGSESASLDNQGTLTASGAGSITNVGDFTNSGTATVRGDAASLTVTDGTVTVAASDAGAGTLAITGDITVSNTTNMEVATLDVGDNILTSGGTITIGGGGPNADGILTVGSSGAVTATNGITLDNGAVLSTAGTITGSVDGGTTAALGGTNDLSGEITGDLTAGSAALTGDLTLGGNADIENLLNVGTHHLDAGGSSTVNAGNIAIGDGGQITAQTVTMESGGLDMTMSSAGAGATVTGNVEITGGDSGPGGAGASGLLVSGAANSISGDLDITDGNLEGTTDSSTDFLNVAGTVTINGTIDNIALSGGTITLTDELILGAGAVLDFDITDFEQTGTILTNTAFGATTDGSLIVSGAATIVQVDGPLDFTNDDFDDITVEGGGTLDVDSAVTGAGVFTQNSGTVDIADGVAVEADTFTLTGGIMNVGAGSSVRGLTNTVTVGGGAALMTMNIGDGGDITDNGNLEILDNGVVDFAGNGEIFVDADNNGTPSVSTAAAGTNDPGSADGTLRLSGAGTVTIGGGDDGTPTTNDVTIAFDNQGLIDIQAGATLTEATGDTVNISGNGDLNIASTGALTVSDFDNGTGTADIDGILTLDDGAQLDNAGTIDVSNTINVGATGTIANSGTLHADAGTVTITGSVTNVAGDSATLDVDVDTTISANLTNNATGIVDVADGADFDVTGAVTSGGATFSLGTQADVDADSTSFGSLTSLAGTALSAERSLDIAGALTNSGTVTTTGEGNLTVGGLLTNNPAGVINVDGDLSLTAVGNTLANAGTITMTGTNDDETVTINGDTPANPVALNNSGTLNLGVADLALGGGTGTALNLTNTGTIDVDANGAITVDTLANNGTGTSGNGVMTVGGTVTIAGGTGSLDNSAAVTTDADGAQIDGDFVNVAGQNASLTVNEDTTITGDLTNNADGIVTVADEADFDVTGAVTSGGTTFTLGTLGDVDTDSTSFNSLTNLAPRVITADRSLDIAGALTNSGTVTTTGEGNLTIGGLLTNNPAGVISVDGSLSLTAVGNTLANAGTITMTATNNSETVTIDGDAAGTVIFTNDGTLNLGGADLALDVGGPATSLDFNNNNTVNVGLDGVISADDFDQVGGTLDLDGELNLASPQAITNDATSSINLSGVLNTGGATGNVNNQGTITVDGDTVPGSGVASITGNLLNQTNGATGGQVNVNADLDITGNLTNQANATVTVGTGADAALTGVLNNAGTITVNGTGTLAVDQAATTVVNSGTINLNGTSDMGANDGGAGIGSGTMTFTNQAVADLNIAAGAELFANVTNDGTLDSDGTIDGNLINQGTNASTVAGAVTGTFTNSAATVAAGTAGLTIDGAVTINAGAGSLDNTGELNVDAAISGTLNNDAGGTTTLAGNVSGDVTNDVGATLTVDGASTVTGLVDNDGAMTIAATGALTSTNNAVDSDGTLQFEGGTITGDVDADANVGVIAGLGNQIDGTLANGTQLTVLTGTQLEVTGLVTNEAGALVDINGTGTLVADLNSTAAGAVIDLDGNLTGNITNASDFDLAGNVTGDVTNQTAAGDLDVDGASSITGTLRNQTGGSINVNNDQTLSVGNVVNAAGTLDVLGTIQGIGGANTSVSNSVSGDLNLTAGVITGTVINNGTVTSTGVSQVTNVTNNSTFDLDTGQLNVDGTFTNNADLNIDSGTNLRGAVVATGAAADTQVDGTLIGTLTNSNGADATVANSVTGLVTNESGATVTVDAGASVGSLSNAGGGIATINGDVDNNLINAGTMTISGGVTVGDTTTNSGTGELDVSSGATLSSIVVAQGTGTVRNAGEIVGDVTVEGGAGATLALANGTVTGDVDIFSNGLVRSTGISVISGQVTNTGGQLTTAAGTLSIGGTVTSTNNNLTVAAGATTNANGGVSASADSEIDVFGTLNTPSMSLAASDLVVGAAGTVNGNVNAANASTIDLNGTINGDVTSVDGTMTMAGTIDGALEVTGGPLVVDGASTVTGAATLSGLLNMDANLSVGTLVAGSLDLADGATLSGGAARIAGTSNLGAGTINNNITFGDDVTAAVGLDLAGTTTSTAVFDAAGNVDYSGTLINQGSFSFGGTQASFGGLTNSGTFTTQNNRTGDAVTVNGPLTVNDGVFNMDVDLNRAGPSSDTVTVRGGAATGTGVVNFNDITGNATFTKSAILVFDLDQSQENDLDLVASGLPTSGATAFVFTDRNLEANGLTSGDYAVVVGANPAIGGIAGGIALTQSLIGSVINRPSSPFVAGLAAADENPCGVGVWSRATGGAATTIGETTTNVGTFTGEVEATYGGFQIGGDYACFDGFYNGWDLVFGGILGLNQGSTEQLVFDLDTSGTLLTNRPPSSITESDFQQSYLGAYVAAARGPLLADLQFRLEETSFDISNRGINGGADIGLNDQEFDVSSYTVSGSLSYAYPINEELGITVIPTAGFSYTKSETDSLSFADGSTLVIDDSSTEVAFIGATVARTVILPDQVSAINYFATGTIYNDFSDGTTATYFSSFGTEDETSATNLGTYGELSLGLNYTRILQPGAPLDARQINGSIRLDGRTGEDIDSWGLTAQVRVQF